MQLISEADHEGKNPCSSKEKGRLCCKEEDPIHVKKKPAAAAPKKRLGVASKGKPVSLATQKLELNKQVIEFVASAFKGKRTAYFVNGTERKEGAYIVCFAVEGEAGFYKMDWGWHCSLAQARAETALMNKKLGLNEEEVNRIIISTMGPVIRRKK